MGWFYPKARKVIVHTKTDKSFRGFLVRKLGKVIWLKKAELLTEKEAVPLDGDVLIEEANVDFVQVIQ